ncbi:MAG TPA: ABC transporter permease [Chitinophagaceae bacterium]|nr:ABC transporter permease [Chitinophagaceae bacterium]
MIRNYFKTAWRNIRKNKLFSFINILGLSIGIATCFVIMLYVQDELSYDRFNKNADNIVRVLFRANINGGKINESVAMPPLAEAMKRDFPQVQDATRIQDQGSSKIIYKNKVFKADQFANVDANFFSIFTLPILKGDAKTALLQPHTVVMTQSTAKKYFGNEDPIGKTIIVTADDNRPYIVTGIVKDIPVNSHFHFDVFGSMKSNERASEDTWMSGGFHTYLLLKPGTDIKQMETGFPAMVKKYMGPAIQQAMGLSLNDFITKGNSLGFALQPLTDIHLNSSTTTEFEPGGNEMYVYIFGGVAIFMLIVACINFINLSTAGASKRAKEVGIRKVAGSGKFQLIGQFLSESILITFFALFIAFALVQLALPAFDNISGKHLSFDVKPVLAFVGLGLLVGVAAGIYPAFYLSSFKPIAVLKGKLTANHKSFGLRSSLVVFQFFISVALIIATIVVYQQMKYMQNKDLGYNKEQLLTIPNSYALGKNEQAYKQQLLQNTEIENATMSWYKPADGNYNNALAYPQGNDNNVVNGVDYHVDENYIPTLGMHIVSGRNFSKDFPTDSSAIILNETAAKALGWNNATAIDKTVIRQNSDKGRNFPFHVIGVVKNFNFKSLHEAISPLYMSLQPESGLIFKIKTTDVASLLATMKKQWDGYNTGEPFTYTFMDDLFNKTYSAEQKTGTILNIFSVLIIFVACLGLFGLATYTSEQRTKEIGIRKVLGASVMQVTQMLSTEFLKLVLIASLIAFPAAWWAMHKWLQSFAYRINISWWVFIIAGITALIIALITVSFQAIKAAVANPVKSLRTE